MRILRTVSVRSLTNYKNSGHNTHGGFGATYPAGSARNETVKKFKKEDSLIIPPSVVFLVLIAHIRPHIVINDRIRRVFIMGPQITEGVVLRVFWGPPPLAAPCALPASIITAAVSARSRLPLPIRSHLTVPVVKKTKKSFLLFGIKRFAQSWLSRPRRKVQYDTCMDFGNMFREG